MVEFIELTSSTYWGRNFAKPEDFYIRPDGLRLYVVNGITSSNSNIIVSASLTTAWNISAGTTGSAAPVITGSYISSEPKGIYFKTDGSRLYVVGSGSMGTIQEFTLTTPWQLPTGFNPPLISNIYAPDTNLAGISFTDNGKYCYLLGVSNKAIYEYELENCVEYKYL